MTGRMKGTRGDTGKLRGPERVRILLTINGRQREIYVEPRRTLLDALREDLGLAGTKKGCDEGTCGACTVLADGRAIYACMALAIDCQGKSIETIESLEKGGILHPIQTAFIEEDGLQCGFCTPGQIMSVKALLDSNPHPDQEQVARAMEGNLCRCGAYSGILKAAHRAAELLRRKSENGQGRKDEERV